MLTSFRTTVGNFLLKRHSAAIRRNLSMRNLPGASTIGILYPLFDLPVYNNIEAFVSILQKEHKEVHALGFVQHKELTSRFLPRLSYDYFSMHDVNWYYKPTNLRVQDFIDREFDLLIDLTMEEHLPLKFVAGLSRAHCKVGRFNDENARYYDLMIKVDKKLSLPEFITQIQHYLTIIKPHE